MDGGRNDAAMAAESRDAIGLLIAQRDGYRALKGLADRQRALVTSSEPERLLGVLAERRRHVDRLTTLNGRVRELSGRWSEIYAAMDEGQRRTADGLIHEVRTMLAEILAGDERDAKLLAARMAGVRQEAQTLDESRRACAAYGAAVARSFDGPSADVRDVPDSMDQEA